MELIELAKQAEAVFSDVGYENREGCGGRNRPVTGRYRYMFAFGMGAMEKFRAELIMELFRSTA